MTALDGNAIAGPLHEVFGAEMTDRDRVPAPSCGATAPVAELAVYMRGPGIVARCRRCDTVLIVLVDDPRTHLRRPARARRARRGVDQGG